MATFYISSAVLEHTKRCFEKWGKRSLECIILWGGYKTSGGDYIVTTCYILEQYRSPILSRVKKKAMEELGVIEKQKKLLAAFRERKLSVVVPRYATGAPERDADCAEVVLNKMMRMWELVTTVDDLIAHLPK